MAGVDQSIDTLNLNEFDYVEEIKVTPNKKRNEEAIKSLSFDGLDSDEKLKKFVDFLFEKLDKNKDGKLVFDEIKPFLVKHL